jgi:hypothetical protein
MEMGMKVRNGTPDFSAPSLCESCKLASIIRGQRFDEQIIKCVWLQRTIPFKVSECRTYHPSNQPWINEMEEMAWLLVSRSNGREIGFMRVKDMTDKDRNEHKIWPAPPGPR